MHWSLELGQSGGWVLKHPLEDLRALVDLSKPSLAELQGVWLSNQGLSVLDESLFKLLNKLIGSSSAPAKVEDDVGHLVESEVSEETFVHQFRLKTFPELVVL